ncbi:MAG: ldh [Firmicutes bacterium]|nr:ldh [Bacillota bacterium]
MNASILNELRNIVGKDYVMSAKEDMIIYASDATMFDHWPDAVVQPASRDEVVGIVKVAAKNNIPLTGRGAGTCLSGGAIPLKGGIVVDMARMDRIRKIDAANKIAIVEPGVITFELASQATKLGLLYPPDPSSWKESTLGGNVAECAGGAVDGEMCGPDWTMLITGSEGTLGLITAITLRLVPAPVTKKTMMAIYERLEDAAKTVSVTMASGIIPTTLELMDNMAIVATEKAVKIGLPVQAGGLLLIEIDGMPSTVEENAKRVSDICKECGALEVKVAQTAAEAESLWVARRGVAKAFGQIAPCKFAEDATVPRSLVPLLVEKSLEMQKKYNIPILIVGHAGDGNMHPTIMFDKRDKDAAARAEQALDEVHLVTLELGGTLSGEHGIGFAKAPYLKAETGPVGYKMGQDVKAVLDPAGIMNPGKMFNYEGALH